MIADATIFETVTPRGNSARFACRDGTSDETIVRAIVGADEYRIGRIHDLAGWAFDIGAHIGSVAIALALDFPALRVAALEPVADSQRILRYNIALNGLRGRVIPDERAAAAPADELVAIVHGFGEDRHRHVGNLYTEGERSDLVEAVALGPLMESYGAETVTFVKIDCEGCEWGFLSDPAVARVEAITGEIHGDGDESDRIRDLLMATHNVHVDRERYIFQALLR